VIAAIFLGVFPGRLWWVSACDRDYSQFDFWKLATWC
jgi:hypothetical protein